MRNTITEKKNGFWFISRLDWAKETVSEFVETCQEKLSQKEKKNKKYQNRMFKSCKTIKRFKI